MIIIMAVILVALSAIYFMQVKQMQEDFAIERDTLTSQLTSLLNDYDTLKTLNDTLSVHYEGERQKADSLLQTPAEGAPSELCENPRIREKMTYMREVMTGYIRQIDSLNTINKKLVSENSSIRKKNPGLPPARRVGRGEIAGVVDEGAAGSVIRARDIRLVALSKSDREVSRANRAERLRVDLVLVGNELSTPGERNVYTQIIGPDGYPLVNGSNALFDFEGSSITYSAMRSVDYQNNDLNVSLFYNGPGITSGKYQVEIYTDGHMIGSSEISLR